MPEIMQKMSVQGIVLVNIALKYNLTRLLVSRQTLNVLNALLDLLS